MDKRYVVYMPASGRNATLHTGVTSQLARRVWEHRCNFVDGCTKTNDVHRLVWFEIHDAADAAIVREKQIRKWNRAWKIRVIERDNPYWNDLFADVTR